MTFPQLPDMDLDDYTDLEAGFPISRLQPNSKKQKQFIGGSLEGHPRSTIALSCALGIYYIQKEL